MRERLMLALDLFDEVPRGLMLNVILNGDFEGSSDPKDLRPDLVRYVTIRLFEVGEYTGNPVRMNFDLDLELIPVGHC